ncbi:MAG: hypothetical protein ORN51_11845 [Akkermansiaceae bacterium]|nr:hypothetical protein [Akkermansiaceae bacterium]
MSRYTAPKKITIEDHPDFWHSLLTNTDLNEIDEIGVQLELDFRPIPPWYVVKRSGEWLLKFGTELIDSAKGADGKRTLEAQAAFFNARQIKPLTPEGIVAEADLDDQLDLLEVDPYVPNAPSRRSDRELSRLLALLDNPNQGAAKL